MQKIIPLAFLLLVILLIHKSTNDDPIKINGKNRIVALQLAVIKIIRL
jgi:hypothetical protein